jgi:hypothetical protein
MSINSIMDKATSTYGWNDQTKVAILMDFLDDLVANGCISSADLEWAFEKKMKDDEDASNED